MSNAIRLIRADKGDLPRVMALAREAISAIAPGAYTAHELALWQQYPAARLEEILASGRYRLAFTGPVLLGGAGWRQGDNGEGVVRAVFVAPRAQGLGVGGRLIAFIESEMQLDGRRIARIPAALSAVGFYQKLGYTLDRVDFGETPGDRLPWAWMQRRLEPMQRQAA